MNIKTLCCLVLTLVLTLVATVSAHRVIVFAWVDSGMIYIEGGFGGDRKARECPVSVEDENKNIIHEGKTDQKGEYVFKIPDHVTSDLLIHLHAGTGHKATWRLPYEEIAASEDDQKSRDAIEKKHQLEKTPSAGKIIVGIAVIVFLAFLASRFKKKNTA